MSSDHWSGLLIQPSSASDVTSDRAALSMTMKNSGTTTKRLWGNHVPKHKKRDLSVKDLLRRLAHCSAAGGIGVRLRDAQ